ncbi:MAG TPA: helix-turn-helix transcriptional regulator [Paracoccaceae bacterium]|nr:helix-turn-helix transcriptional regulator [Paracoccaceae bacterium]
MVTWLRAKQTTALSILIAVQVFCASFFLWDVTTDMVEHTGFLPSFHILVELIATLTLIGAIVFEFGMLRDMLSQADRLNRGIRAASGAMQEVLEEYFKIWGLTPSEIEIAIFTIKGMSVAEIAGMRGSAEGTIKTHLHNIYRKSGLSGRGQLISLLVDDLIAAQPMPSKT